MGGPSSDQLALALGPYVNRKLFSDHFLSERLPAWPEFAAAVAEQMLAFVETRNQTATPFTWTYTGKVLGA